jgi:hypothetical protein
MKSFSEYMTESVDVKNLPKTVHIAQYNGQAGNYTGFTGAVASIHQKLAKSDQAIFQVDSYDRKEFGKVLKSGDILCRMSSPMSSNTNEENRTICIINIKNANVKFINQDKYNDGIIAVDRALKFKFLTIDPKVMQYFEISGKAEDYVKPITY